MSVVKVIPLGGSGEIGKNCNVVEQGDDLLVVDCGLSFPNEEMPGIDIVIPDFTYLLENRDRLRGIVLTHAHEDHVGALPYLLSQVECPVYSTEFTLALVRQKLEEKIDVRRIDFRPIAPGEQHEAGSFRFEAVRVTHSIPETTSVAVRTEHGIVLFSTDFKFDFTPVDGKLTQLHRLAELGEEGVLLLLCDCTNVDRPGWGPSEGVVSQGLRQVLRDAPGRVLMTTFASNVHRLQQALSVAAEAGRKVAVAGRRMEATMDICTRLGYLRYDKSLRIRLDDANRYPDEGLLILTTGSQGEPMSALSQLARDEYSRTRIKEGDTVVYSARPIPGNEAAIWRVINRLFEMGANVVYKSETPVHVSGHAYEEEIKMMINLTRPYYVAPVHGEPRHQHRFAEIARQMGFPPHRVFTLRDGDPLCMDERSAWIDERVPCGRVLVDTGGVVGVSDEVLRDRNSLARDGVVIVAAAVDLEQGELVGEPIVEARGLALEEEGLARLADVITDALGALSEAELRDTNGVRQAIAEVTRRTIQRWLQKRPLVLPTLIDV